MHPCGEPVLKTMGEDEMLWILMEWGLFVKKSSTQLHKHKLSPSCQNQNLWDDGVKGEMCLGVKKFAGCTRLNQGNHSGSSMHNHSLTAHIIQITDFRFNTYLLPSTDCKES